MCQSPFKVQITEDKVDFKLKDKLKEEMPGILAWAVEGCLLWQEESLKKPASVLEASGEYMNEMDVLSAFMDACCEDGGEADAGQLFRAYSQWAREGNEFEMSSTKFGREMGKRFDKKKTARGYYYSGISIQHAGGVNKGFRVMY